MAVLVRGRLTERQTEIMLLVRKGLTNQDICSVLGISANTVKVHLANIYKTLDVANRTEAVTVFSETTEKEDGAPPPMIFKKPRLIVQTADTSLSARNNQTAAVVQDLVGGLQKFDTFEIQWGKEPDDTRDTFVLTVEEKDNTCDRHFVCMYQLENGSILWSDILVLDDDAARRAAIDRMVSTIHWKFELAAAEGCRGASDGAVNGWYAVYGIKHLINHREKNAWHGSLASLRMVQQVSDNHIWSLYGLGLAWYLATMERWCAEADGVRELMSIGKKAMQTAPNSQYAWLLMAFLSIVEKRFQDTIAHLNRVIAYNPYNLLAIQVLSQIYTIENRCQDGIDLLKRMKTLAPDFYERPTTIAAEAVLLYFLGDYKSCQKRVDDVLFVLPEFLIPRLLNISMADRLADPERVTEQVKLLKKYHPDFNADSCTRFVSGVAPRHVSALQETLRKAGV